MRRNGGSAAPKPAEPRRWTGPSRSTCRGSPDASWPPRSPLLGRRPVPQVGCAAAVEAQLVSLTSWSASPTWPARSAVTAKRPACSAAAEAVRQRTGEVRFNIHDADDEAAVAAVREAVGD